MLGAEHSPVEIATLYRVVKVSGSETPRTRSTTGSNSEN
jgi:hypothetical protein